MWRWPPCSNRNWPAGCEDRRPESVNILQKLQDIHRPSLGLSEKTLLNRFFSREKLLAQKLIFNEPNAGLDPYSLAEGSAMKAFGALSEPCPTPTDLAEMVALNRCRQILVRNSSRCLECGACQSTCERRHGDRRWGDLPHSFGSLAIMPVCLGCETPSCIAACPRKALRPDATAPSVQHHLCVGCGLCVRACPFAALVCLPAGGKKQPAKTAALRKMAVKCDGCAGHAHRSCVRECPTGALRTLAWKEFLRVLNKQNRTLGLPAVKPAAPVSGFSARARTWCLK